ncbi:bifunctional nuclease in basal defense response1 [Striga asiatica]|uniref:Bifunctional nuclease in basal defense response1 n=1 Tax=Striga asiatica TaxID=4170 RepID=A0A5A7QQM0_STRAF|nr:bifunctional nuclease in basal defense response1 [Striga asiatica]
MGFRWSRTSVLELTVVKSGADGLRFRDRLRLGRIWRTQLGFRWPEWSAVVTRSPTRFSLIPGGCETGDGDDVVDSFELGLPSPREDEANASDLSAVWADTTVRRKIQ